MAASVVYWEGKASLFSGNLCFITNQYYKFVETNEFRIPGSEVVVTLRPTSINAVGTSGTKLLMIHLVEPADDIIPATVPTLTVLSGAATVLRSNQKSTLMCAPMKALTLESPNNYRVSFSLTVKCPWKKHFMTLTPDQPADVVIRVEGKDIPTTEAILTTKSDVFAAMFTHDTKEKQTGVVEITDFSFQVVQEMVRFLMHDYCTGWDGQYEKLAAIADKYDIAGMKKLAAEKKALLDQHP